MTILLTSLAALFLAVAFVIMVPPSYTATTQILIDPTDLRGAGAEPASSNQTNDAVVLQVESQASVLTSDSVLQRVVKAEGLEHDPEFTGSSAANGAAEALNTLKRNIKVIRAERTYVVNVSVTAHEAAKAARIANAIAQAYLDEQTAVRSDAARQISQSLSARLSELKDRLRQAEDRVEAFKSHNNIVGAGGQLISEQQLAEMNNQLSAARARAAAAKARLDQIQQVQVSKDGMGAFPDAVQSTTIGALRSQYAEIMRREAEQMSSLGSRHPAVIEIQAEAERLGHMIDDEVRRMALSARTEYESARANEDTLARDLEKLKGNAFLTNEALVTVRELERDVQANRSVYEAFLVRARETGEQERLDTKNIRVISWAAAPLNRSFPPPNWIVAIGALLLGAAAGSGLAVGREVYGLGPIFAEGQGTLREKLAHAFEAIWARAAAPSSIPVLAVLPNVDVDYGLAAARDYGSRFSTEVRKVLDVLRADGGTRGCQTFLLVAPHDEDEAVMVALVLATVAAETRDVLLIDADLERRTLSAIGADLANVGLVDVATGRSSLSDAIVSDRRTGVNFTSLVSQNSRRDRPLTEADIRQVFARTTRFDVVIVTAIDLDAGPKIKFFAELVDNIVMVARAETDGDYDTNLFASRLGSNAHKIRGAVLTDDESA